MSLFKKNKKVDKDRAFLDLKDAMKKIDLSVQKKEKTVAALKQKALIALSQKNEKLAKIHLAKKLKQEKDIENLYNIQRKLSDQMDAIEQAETIQNATKALSTAVGILNGYAKLIEQMNVEEIVAGSEESLAIIDDAAGLMGDSTMDILEDDQITADLEELQAELALDMGGKLALVPGEVEQPEPGQLAGEPETTVASADDVKKELERLKRELEMN